MRVNVFTRPSRLSGKSCNFAYIRYGNSFFCKHFCRTAGTDNFNTVLMESFASSEIPVLSDTEMSARLMVSGCFGK
jgi:hypothetical protein